MMNIEINQLRRNKRGRQISEYRLNDLKERMGQLLHELDLKEHLCILTFGSAGNLFLTAYSDTDFSVLTDGNVSKQQLSLLQEKIFETFDGKPWTVSFKAWERLKVNPMDVLSVTYLCGNKQIFLKQVINNPEIKAVITKENLVTILSGNDLHLEFMATPYFSRLLNKYHAAWELPVPICFGDLKYYRGGVRWAQFILMTEMLLSGDDFLFLSAKKNQTSSLFLTMDEKQMFETAVDFLLSAKDMCVEGCNIFHHPNIQKISSFWDENEDEIREQYEKHSETIVQLCGKAYRMLTEKFDDYPGVMARMTTDPERLKAIIKTNSPNYWRTLALRRDLPEHIRYELTTHVCDRIKISPHTMLDEILVMLDYSAGTYKINREIPNRSEKEKTELWLTDKLCQIFKSVLKTTTDRPELIRLAIHKSFFDLYTESPFNSPEEFAGEYLNRARNYFHCHTLFPDREYRIASEAVRQLLISGQFSAGKIAMMELHLTNRCNLNCIWCTYRDSDRNAALSFEDIREIIKLKPAEILIAGGGEPTLFRDRGYGFSDVICFLRKSLPGSRIRLITNGTFIPEGQWINEMDEISISLDEGTREGYQLHKGKDLFDQVWQNIAFYLQTAPLSCVRITKIYSKDNLPDALNIAEKLFLLWQEMPSSKRPYVKLMVFPLANDRNRGQAYADSELSVQEICLWHERLNCIRQQSAPFFNFLQSNTNLFSVKSQMQKECIPEHCWNAANYILVGADKILYPCFAACSVFQGIHYGPAGCIDEELTQRRLNLFVDPPVSCSAGCRPGNVFYGLRSKEIYLAQKKKKLPYFKVHRSDALTIVHVSYQDPDHLLGGQGWAVYHLCREQIKRGCLVYWISPCVKDEQPGEYFYGNGNLRVLKIAFSDEYVETLFSDSYENHLQRKEFGNLMAEKIKTLFLPENCIIHLHGFIEIPSHALELRDAGYKVLSTFHMLLSSRRQHILASGSDLSYMKEAEKDAVGNNTVITIPAIGMIKELSAVSPDYSGRFYCVPNGIGDEHFDTPKDGGAKKNDLIVSYGRISPEKGFDLLIEAARMIDRSQLTVPAEFLIFGSTDMAMEARKAYADKLKKMTAGYDHIQILASQTGITGAEKIQLLDQAVFGVIPSLYEPFGLVIPELMARGKPVIATKTCGACDIMQTSALGKNDFGFLVKPEPEAIFEAILWLLNHPEKCAEMGRNAYERACDFRWETIASKFEKVYKNL